MATSPSPESQDRSRLYKFTKVLTLKVAQIVVQSRQGKKITQEFNANKQPEITSTSPSVQWFNLSIPDKPEVNCDAKRVLNGEVVSALSNILCIEIALETADGDHMVLELWTVRMLPGCDVTMTSVSTIYYRMSIMLKSTLSISRITPAYKMSRLQSRENYKIYYKIYGGAPNISLLGENHKAVKVSELKTPIGTINIEVLYRTKMAILPDHKQKTPIHESSSNSEDIMVVSNHFPRDSPRKGAKQDDPHKKQVDLSKPLTAGAFVDTKTIQELHDTLSMQLPPEPPMSWLLAEKEKLDLRQQRVSSEETSRVKAGGSNEAAGHAAAAPRLASKAIEVPRPSDDKLFSLMDFPFADGSPITELATFYQECLQARSATGDWAAEGLEPAHDAEPLAEQLRRCEEAVPEFDHMVASMLSNSNSDYSSDF